MNSSIDNALRDLHFAPLESGEADAVAVYDSVLLFDNPFAVMDNSPYGKA